MLFLCKKKFFRFVFMLCFGVTTFSVHAVSEFTQIINQADWPEYENGTNVMSLPQIRNIFSRFEEHEKITVEVRYPGGDFGKNWAESLRKWFIAYGIPKSYIELLPGSGAAEQIVVALIDRR